MPSGVYPRTKEMYESRRYNPWNKGLTKSDPRVLSYSLKHKGFKMSDEARTKIRVARKLQPSPMKGRTLSSETKMKLSNALRGSVSFLWKDGRSKLSTLIRRCHLYGEWRMRVFTRDLFTCQKCSKNKCYLEPHHKKQFSIILSEFLKKYSQFSPIEDKETLVRLSFTYEEFWDVDNGETLCSECHNLTKKHTCYRKQRKVKI